MGGGRGKGHKKAADAPASVPSTGVALLVPNATVFVSGFCVMVIELVAGRIIARHLGSSLYTWTSVIGIVLSGLAIGNYIGGRLADRFAVRRTLTTLFVVSSAACVLISVCNNLVGDLRFLWSLPWPARVALHVAFVFFAPSCLLGMISPVVAKMALDAGFKTGRTIGNVYAWGVVGSIVGTFATGFFLVAWLGTSTIILGVAVVLALIAVLYSTRSWKAWVWMAVVVAIITLATSSAKAARSLGERLALREPVEREVLYFKESEYSYIKVLQLESNPHHREMHLDALLHSKIDMQRPTNLQYSYEKMFAAITARLFSDEERVDNLMIGGGGYVFPRYMNAIYPGSRTDVVEIDPAVTEAARLAFGLPVDAPINFYHEDARVFVDRLRQQKQDGEPVSLYDVIYVDAFNHHAVPFQLTTLEFVNGVRDLLKPNGAYLVNLIDTFGSGRFVGAMVNTVMKVFPYVYVFVEGGRVQDSPGSRKTFVIAGTHHPFDTTNLEPGCGSDCRIYTLTAEQLASLARKSRQLLLTDEFAPVENLLASVARTHAIDRAFGDWLRTIRAAADRDDFDRAASLARDALAVFPDSPGLASDYANLLTELGAALRSKGDVKDAAIEYSKALQRDPEHVRARLGLIDCRRDLGQLKASLPLFPPVLDYDPLVRYNYATTLAQVGRYSEAVEQFKKVTALLPELASAYNNCGNCLYRLGDTQGAIEQFRLALKYAPNHPDAGPNLARLLESTKREK